MGIFLPRKSTNLLDASQFVATNSYTTCNLSDDGYRIEVVSRTVGTWNRAEYNFDTSLVQNIAGKTVYFIADSISKSNPDAAEGVQLVCTLDDGTIRYFLLYPEELTRKCNISENTISIKIQLFTNKSGTPLTADNTLVVEGLRLTLIKDAPWEPYGIVDKVKLYMPSSNLFDYSKLTSMGQATMEVAEEGYKITVVGGGKNAWSRVTRTIEGDELEQFRGKTLYWAMDGWSASNPDTSILRATVELFDEGGVKTANSIIKTKRHKFVVTDDIIKITLSLNVNTNTVLETDNTVVFEGVRLTLNEDAPWQPYGLLKVKKVYLPCSNLLDVSQFSEKYTAGGITWSREGDYIGIKGTWNYSYGNCDVPCFIKEGTTIYLYAVEGDVSNVTFVFRDVNNKWIAEVGSNTLGVAKTLSADCHIFRVAITNASYDTRLKLLLTTVQNAPWMPYHNEVVYSAEDLEADAS